MKTVKNPNGSERDKLNNYLNPNRRLAPIGKYFNLIVIFILLSICGCKNLKNMQGNYYNFPSRNSSNSTIVIKDSTLFLDIQGDVNSSGQYLYTKKGDTLFLRTLKADSNYWKSSLHPIKYALIKRGYIYINNDFHDSMQNEDVIVRPVLARKRNIFFCFKMSLFYRNESKRLLVIINKSSMMRCKKTLKLFNEDCTIELYHKLPRKYNEFGH